jgi:drug/metabolite transporter (DMT)-like permease
MSWLIYALICAIFTSAAALVQKKTLIKQHAMEFSASLALINFILSIPLFFFIDFSNVTLQALGLIFVVSFFGSIAFLLIAKSIRHMEISAASPLLVLGPGISALLAFFILGERLTILQSVGILTLIIGSYILELKNHHDLFHPLRVVKQSKYVYFIFLALLIYGFCAVFDRMLLTKFAVEPLTYIAFVHVFIAFHFLVLMTFFHDGIKGIKFGIKNAGPWLFVIAILTISYRLAQMEAVKMAYVGLVLPVKRMSALFTTVIGGGIYHEHNLLRKVVSCMIMIVGVLMLVL